MEYFVTGNLNHDGREYARGDSIVFTDESAIQPLLDAGVIQTEPVAKPQAEDITPETAPEQQPEVTGKPLATGEPSIDGEEERGEDNAEDITPGARRGRRRALSPDVGPQDASEPQDDPSANL